LGEEAAQKKKGGERIRGANNTNTPRGPFFGKKNKQKTLLGREKSVVGHSPKGHLGGNKTKEKTSSKGKNFRGTDRNNPKKEFHVSAVETKKEKNNPTRG